MRHSTLSPYRTVVQKAIPDGCFRCASQITEQTRVQFHHSNALNVNEMTTAAMLVDISGCPVDIVVKLATM